MTTRFACEPLEPRGLFAATAVALDTRFLFGYSAIKDKVGTDFRVFEALPISDGRTLLLADRGEKFEAGHVGRTALLTLIVVKDDGTLDGTFGDAGVALTGRIIEYLDKPGRVAVDGAGRVYFADSTRVIRLTRRGATDRSFGNNGAIGFAPANKPVQLCDIVPTNDDGVLVATTQVIGGKRRFAVQKVGRTVSTVWGTKPIDTTDDEGAYTSINPGYGQFAAAGNTIVFARTEADYTRIPDTDPEAEPGDTIFATSRQQVILTRFDGTGADATEVAHQDLRRPGLYGSSAIGTDDYRFPNYHNVRLTDDARYAQVLTTQELLRFDLKTSAYKRSKLPGTYTSPGVALSPNYQLLADGGLGVFFSNYDKKGRPIIELDRYRPDGTHDSRYTDGGVFVVKQTDFPGGRGNAIDQLFLDAYGRLNYLSTGTITESPSRMALRRLA